MLHHRCVRGTTHVNFGCTGVNPGKNRGPHPNHNGRTDGQIDIWKRREILVGSSAVCGMHTTFAIIDEGIGAIVNVKIYVEWGVRRKICISTGVTESPRVDPSACRFLLSMQEVPYFCLNTFLESTYGWIECHVVPFKVPMCGDWFFCQSGSNGAGQARTRKDVEQRAGRHVQRNQPEVCHLVSLTEWIRHLW